MARRLLFRPGEYSCGSILTSRADLGAKLSGTDISGHANAYF